MRREGAGKRNKRYHFLQSHGMVGAICLNGAYSKINSCCRIYISALEITTIA